MISDEGVAVGIVGSEGITGRERLVDADAGCGVIGWHRSGMLIGRGVIEVPPAIGRLEMDSSIGGKLSISWIVGCCERVVVLLEEQRRETRVEMSRSFILKGFS